MDSTGCITYRIGCITYRRTRCPCDFIMLCAFGNNVVLINTFEFQSPSAPKQKKLEKFSLEHFANTGLSLAGGCQLTALSLAHGPNQAEGEKTPCVYRLLCTRCVRFWTRDSLVISAASIRSCNFAPNAFWMSTRA